MSDGAFAMRCQECNYRVEVKVHRPPPSGYSTTKQWSVALKRRDDVAFKASCRMMLRHMQEAHSPTLPT